MKKHDHKQANGRRSFLGSIATGAAAIGMATLAVPYRQIRLFYLLKQLPIPMRGLTS